MSHRHQWNRMAVLLGCCLALSLFLVPGCGSGGDNDGGGTDSLTKIDHARDKADLARASAEKLGASKYAPEMWKEAKEFYDKGEDMEASGNSKAASRFKMAESRFRKAEGTAKRNKKSYDKAVTAQEKYEKLRKTAEGLKLNESHPELWTRAEEHYTTGKSHLGNSKKLKAAYKEFRYACNELDNAVSRSKQVANNKQKAEKMRSEAAAMRTKAEEANAPERSLANFEYGRDAQKEGDDYFSQGLYDQAQNSFRSAKDWYTYAIEDASQKAVAEKLQDANHQPDIDYPDSREEAPSVDDIEIPDFQGGDDIVTDLRRLFHCAYEYDNGIINLNYASGIELQKDVHTRGAKVTGPANKRNLLFEGRDGVGGFARGFDEDEEEDYDEEEDDDTWMDYSFAGNTNGELILNCRFKNGVQIEFDVAYQLIIANAPTFQVLINSNRKNSFYATDWGTWLINSEDKRATKRSHTKSTAFPKKPPQLWVNKRKPHHFKVRYNKKGDDDDGRLRVWYNDELTFDIKTANKYNEGFVGFRWHDVKFVVTNLQVKGRLDTEWAREALAKVGDEPEPEDIEDDFDF